MVKYEASCTILLFRDTQLIKKPPSLHILNLNILKDIIILSTHSLDVGSQSSRKYEYR